MIRPDPQHPNTIRAARMVADLTWQYVLTHTEAECAELVRRAERDRQIRQRLFGTPRPVDVADKSA